MSLSDQEADINCAEGRGEIAGGGDIFRDHDRNGQQLTPNDPIPLEGDEDQAEVEQASI